MDNTYCALWKVNQTQIGDALLFVSSDGRCEVISNDVDINTIISEADTQYVYSNFEHYLNPFTSDKLVVLPLSEFEMKYVASLLGTSLPCINRPVSKDFIVFLKRFHTHYSSMRGHLERGGFIANESDNSFLHSIKWLSRSNVRIYPTESLMDKHAYCTRWSGSHWGEMLCLGTILDKPTRDPKALKGLRADPSRIKFIDGCAFLLVNINKTKVPVDFPLNTPVWMTNIELQAMLEVDSNTRFEVEDILRATITPHSHEILSILNDNSLMLSVTFGMAIRACLRLFNGSWSSAFWYSVERARWLSLFNEVNEVYPLQLSGFGSGAMSFYCWSGDLFKICEMLKIRASVLKQSDYDLDELLLEEISSNIKRRYSDLQTEQPDETYSNTI